MNTLAVVKRLLRVSLFEAFKLESPQEVSLKLEEFKKKDGSGETQRLTATAGKQKSVVFSDGILNCFTKEAEAKVFKHTDESTSLLVDKITLVSNKGQWDVVA